MEKSKKSEKSKIRLNRIWLAVVIAGGCFIAVYFETNPVWTVIGMFAVFCIPFTFDLIIATHEAIEYDRKRRTPGNTPRKLKGFIGYTPVYEEPRPCLPDPEPEQEAKPEN
jgi:hypothetical protein